MGVVNECEPRHGALGRYWSGNLFLPSLSASARLHFQPGGRVFRGSENYQVSAGLRIMDTNLSWPFASRQAGVILRRAVVFIKGAGDLT